jgi:hypothetical protein
MAKVGNPRRKNKTNGGRRKNAVKHHRRRVNRHRNPSLTALVGSPRQLLTGAVAGLASAVATRQIPQAIMGASNTGVEGYAANLVTLVLATWAAATVAGPDAGRGAAIGGAVILLDRILSDNVSPISSYLALSGVGDHNAYSKLGTIRQGYYTHPGINNPDGSLYVPDPYTDAAVQAIVAKYPQLAAPIMAATGSGGGGQGRMGAVNPSALRKHVASGVVLSSRFQGRFNQ